MNDCLLTKLSGVVQNPAAMPVFGKWSVTRDVAAPNDWDYSTDTLIIRGTVGSEFTIDSDTLLYVVDENGVSYTLPYTTTIGARTYRYFGFQNVGTINISGKYDAGIGGVGNVGTAMNYRILGSFSDFCTKDRPMDVDTINCQLCGIGGDIESVSAFPNLAKLYIRDNSIFGNVIALQNLVRMRYLDMRNTYINGDIAVLGGLPLLTDSFIENSGLSGTVEDFVQNRITAGVTSTGFTSPVRLSGVSGVATFGGIQMTGSSGFIGWDSMSRIVVYTGGTYTNNSYNHVYVKGATSTEIENWENAGKTVTVIE